MKRSLLVALIAVVLLVGVVQAQAEQQAHYAILTVDVLVDESVESDLKLIPDPEAGIDVCPEGSRGDVCITVEPLPPGGMAAVVVAVENRSGTVVCESVFANYLGMSQFLTVQTWPIWELGPMKTADVTLIITVSEEAPDMTTLTVGLGLICVQ